MKQLQIHPGDLVCLAPRQEPVMLYAVTGACKQQTGSFSSCCVALVLARHEYVSENYERLEDSAVVQHLLLTECGSMGWTCLWDWCSRTKLERVQAAPGPG